MSYAVVWNDGGVCTCAGRLELGPRSLRLEGSAPTACDCVRVVSYEELVGVRVERRREPGRESRPSLVLACRDGSRVEVTPVAGAGILHELAERLGAARGRAAERPAPLPGAALGALGA
jgi:hypothetical protein